MQHILLSQVKQLRATSVKRLLREAGYNLTDIASIARVYPSTVSRVVRKKATSRPVWQVITNALNGLYTRAETDGDVQAREEIPA
jgi:hypothetical protein